MTAALPRPRRCSPSITSRASSWPHAARLLLTGQVDRGTTIAAISRGRLHRYITKPWNDAELVLELRQVAQNQQLRADKRALERLTQQQNDDLIGRFRDFERRHGLALTLAVPEPQEASR